MPFIKVNDKQVHYVIHGEQGHYLVLLNGLMMSTASWNHLIPELKKHYRVICIDMHDMGLSQKMDQEYKHDVQVECVASVIQHVTSEKVHLCGTSYGAMVGLQLALKYPDLIQKIMVFNTSAYTNKQLRDIGRLWEKAAATYNADHYYDEFAPLLYSAPYYENHHQDIYKRKELIRPFVTKEYCDSIIRLSRSSVGYDIRARLHEIQHPILVVGSDVDYLTPVADQYYLAEHLANAELVIIPGAGHGVIFEKVILLASLIVGWFRQIDAQIVFKKDPE